MEEDWKANYVPPNLYERPILDWPNEFPNWMWMQRPIDIQFFCEGMSHYYAKDGKRLCLNSAGGFSQIFRGREANEIDPICPECLQLLQTKRFEL